MKSIEETVTEAYVAVMNQELRSQDAKHVTSVCKEFLEKWLSQQTPVEDDPKA